MSKEPIGHVRAGAISVSIWENEIEIDGAKKKVRNVTIQRGYKNKKGEWENTNSIGMNDVPKLILALQRVYGEELSN